jgi:hypothetical protein
MFDKSFLAYLFVFGDFNDAAEREFHSPDDPADRKSGSKVSPCDGLQDGDKGQVNREVDQHGDYQPL